jgi:sn-glycerol 3-phosphate transport system ATP-binding protein
VSAEGLSLDRPSPTDPEPGPARRLAPVRAVPPREANGADIRLENVAKFWGATAAVDAVSFAAPAGALVALLGPSGCGKSTTLRLIAGLETASAGAIAIGGRDVTRLPPARRGVSMVFQNYALFPHISVAENIVFGLKVRNEPAAERKARLEHAAGILGLEQLLDRKPSQLSGGQQQRVALGRAIVARTPVCLMDEPLSNLDAQLRVEMRREIRALQQRLGITVLYVTHDQIEAMTMADQVVLMRNGRIEQDAAPADLYDRPATIFAARFIGTPPMNVVPLERLAASPSMLASAPAGRPVESLALGLRPETVRIADRGVPARVVASEYLGADTLVETSIGGASFALRLPGRAALALDEIVHLAWDPAAAHWFDGASERRIE